MPRLTLKSIEDKSRASGYKGVVKKTVPNGRVYWMAEHGTRAHRKGEKTNYWHGPGRATPKQAAQDYCDYVNGAAVTATPTLKTANHPKAQRAETDIERVAVRAKGRARRKGLRGHVYLVQEKGNKRAVKVGHTFQSPPQARLNGLQTGNPRLLIMLAAKSGTEADEATLHAKYIAHNILGEWFRPTVRLLSEFGLKKEDLS